MGKALRLEGQVFGELTVICRVGRTVRGYTLWRCRCSCGEELDVSTAKLRDGVKRVCSRNKPEHRPSIMRGHELTYASWAHMRERCVGKRGQANKDYGGRGIKICERWDSFNHFLEDMGDRPSIEYSIERLDVNGNYELNNCKWGTDQEQRRNKRRSIYVEWEGRRWFLKDLCDELGLKYSIVAGRHRGLGWSLERALTEPVGGRKEMLRLPRWLRGETKGSVARKNSKYVMVTMTPELYARVVSAAEKDRRSLTDWGRLVFEDHLDSDDGTDRTREDHRVVKARA